MRMHFNLDSAPCSADLACGIAVWSRAILPQILGGSLPSLQSVQLSEAHNVHSLSPALTDVALKYGEGVLEESEDFGDQPPKATRLGPIVDDPKGLFALKLTETVLLRRAEEGVQVQVETFPHFTDTLPSFSFVTKEHKVSPR